MLAEELWGIPCLGWWGVDGLVLSIIKNKTQPSSLGLAELGKNLPPWGKWGSPEFLLPYNPMQNFKTLAQPILGKKVCKKKKEKKQAGAELCQAQVKLGYSANFS